MDARRGASNDDEAAMPADGRADASRLAPAPRSVHGAGWLRRLTNTARGLAQRWAPGIVKRALWNREYETGRWRHCERTEGAAVYAFVERYCRGGSILDLGCGSGNTGNEIDIARYREYTGVDLSTAAIAEAIRRSREMGRQAKNRYIAADLESFEPTGRFDVILFRESLYYVPLARICPTLDRYRRFLAHPDGVVIVNFSRSGTKRFDDIHALLHDTCTIVETYRSSDLDSDVMVLR
jgi:SAM-dependent methyltransferase